MFKGLGNIASLLKNAGEMKTRMEELRKKIDQMKVEAESGGGLVAVEARGDMTLANVRIDPSLLESGDQEMLEDLVLSAVNLAIGKAKAMATEEMKSLAGGMDIPGLDDALASLTGGNAPD